MKKNTIKINEGQLREMISESINKILSESKGKNKLQNSFKSKEDMTRYRDMYEPNASDTIIDTDGDVYDQETTNNGAWGSGPYRNYRYHTFADGYDYCGDDDYNERASEYNDGLYKRLATKGGQMSYDWENDSTEALNRDDIESQHFNLDSASDERLMRDLEDERTMERVRNAWVNGEISDETYGKLANALKDMAKNSYDNYSTDYRDKEMKRQNPRGYNYYRTPFDRKRAISMNESINRAVKNALGKYLKK